MSLKFHHAVWKLQPWLNAVMLPAQLAIPPNGVGGVFNGAKSAMIRAHFYCTVFTVTANKHLLHLVCLNK